MAPRLIAVVVLLAVLPWRPALGQDAGTVSPQAYEGWRQYSVHCARCHGQDVLGNPVAANLLESAAPGGAMAEEEPFVAVVLKGRQERGMPGFQDQMSPEQASAVYVYVRGRAHREIPPGRPKPSGS